MTGTRHFLLASVVTRTQWQNERQDVLRAVHATLQERAQHQGLQLEEPPAETIEVLAGGTRVRITLSAEGTPIPTSALS